MNANANISSLVDKKMAAFFPLLNRPLSTDSIVSGLFDLFNGSNGEMLWHIAEINKIDTVLADSFLQCGHSMKVPTAYTRKVEKQGNNITTFLRELNAIGDSFAKRGVSFMVLENGGLAYVGYCNSGCFTFGDFDLLLNLKHFRKANEILQESGYELLTKTSANNSTGFDLTSGRLEFIKRFDNDINLRLNIQPTLVARKWFFSATEPDYGTLLHRSIDTCGYAVRVLGCEDFLFQLCVHNAAHGYIRKPGIRLHLDIDWYIRSVHNEIDWSTFIALVQQMHVTTIVYFSLLIPKVILGTPVPNVVISTIRPSAWKERLIMKTLARGDLLAPDKRQFSKLGFLLFNILIHDSFKEMFRAVFPTLNSLTKRYGLMEKQSRFMFLYNHYKQAVFGTR